MQKIFPKVKKSAVPLDIRIGTGALAYQEWKGRFYPKDLPPENALAFYARTFSALELNHTFFRLPSPAAIKELAAKAPPDFLFSTKAHRLITHIKRLKDCEEPLQKFLETLAPFKAHRGPVLIQLPPNFKFDLERLQTFFKLIPTGLQVAVEFRHSSWFVPAVFDFLRQKRAALVFNDTDVPDMPEVATADWGYLRLRRLKYSEAELKSRAASLRKQKWTRAYVIFKHEEKATAPGLAQRFKAVCKPG